MKAVQLGPARQLSVVEHAARELGPGEVRVDVGYCGICGSDLHMRDVVDPGAVFGHEFAGTIAGLGDDIDDWDVGDNVAVLIYTNCGECLHCQSGNEHQCLHGGHHGDVIGVQIPGGYAESVIAPQASLYALPDGVSVRHGAFVEPLGVAVRAASAIPETDGDEPVVVIGAGPIGLLTGFALRERGRHVVIMERNPGRGDFAAGLGFSTITGADPLAEVARLGMAQPSGIVECAGSAGATNAALELLRRQGTLVMVGLPMKLAEIDVDTLILKEINAKGSAAYSRQDFQTAIDVLASGEIPVDDLVTGVVALEDTERAFAELTDPATSHVKILIEP